MQKEEIKFKDSCIFEGMTSIRATLRGIDEGYNDRPIDKILFDVDKLKKIGKDIGYLKAVSKKYGYEIVESNGGELDRLALGTSHGGIIAFMGKRTLPCLSSQIHLPERGFFAMIEGIEDPYNFGYSLRSLYAMGCDGIVLPERNWMSAAGVVARSSAGASERLPMYCSAAEDACEIFKKQGYSILCAEEKTDLILGECELTLPILLVVGGEKRGISKSVLELADMKVKIGYSREFRASLSAASATTMFAYEIARQNK